MARYPQFAASNILRGRDLRASQSEIVVCATADTGVNMPDTKADTELFMLLEPNADYIVHSVVLFRSTVDVTAFSQWVGSILVLGNIGRTQVFAPTSSPVAADFTAASNTKASVESNSASGTNHQVNADSLNSAVWAKFTVHTTGQYEMLQHMWCHTIGAVANLTRDAGSYMRVTRYG
jgi:hypothetical protein